MNRPLITPWCRRLIRLRQYRSRQLLSISALRIRRLPQEMILLTLNRFLSLAKNNSLWKQKSPYRNPSLGQRVTMRTTRSTNNDDDHFKKFRGLLRASRPRAAGSRAAGTTGSTSTRKRSTFQSTSPARRQSATCSRMSSSSIYFLPNGCWANRPRPPPKLIRPDSPTALTRPPPMPFSPPRILRS